MNFAYNIIFVSISSSCYVWLLPKGKHTTQVPQMSNILTCITALSTWNAAEVRKRRRHVTSEEVVRRKQFTNTAHNHSSNRSADLTSTATIPPLTKHLQRHLKYKFMLDWAATVECQENAVGWWGYAISTTQHTGWVQGATSKQTWVHKCEYAI